MAAEDTEPQSPRAESPSAETNSKKRKNSITEIAVDLALPEPPSKKAKRALKKGKVLPPKPASDAGSDAEDDKEAEKKKAKKERSPWGVWIGNLRFSVNKKELREWLITNSGGAITEDLITRVHIPSNKPEKKEKKEKRVGGRKDKEEEDDDDETEKKGFQNKGFAYVDFSTEIANVAAIALSETEWHGRKLLIKDSKSFEGRPAKVEPEPVAADAASKPSKPEAPVSTATKVFVGNMSFNTNEDELWAHFEKCGPIRWVKVATFEDTGKCKGYGWVNFEEHEAAEWAVKGFVKIKETIETIEDFEDPKEDGDDSTPEEEGKTQLVRKEKIRKWWVNQLNGRNLKIELAEDDQSRYKKRFGKDAPAKKGRDGEVRPQRRERLQAGQVIDNDKLSGGNRRSWKERRDEDNAADPLPPREEKKKDVSISYHDDIQVARLTGAAVKPMGKKVTFD